MKQTSLLCLFLLFLASCSSPSKKHYTIAVSQCSEDIWRDKLNKELLTASYAYDNVSLQFASANDDDKKQIAQINHFIDEHVDLLIVSPNQLHTISSVIEKAYDSGISVILFDRRTDTKKYTTFIGADNYDIGFNMGNCIAEDIHGHGNIVEIMGLKSSSPAMERHRGFVAALKAYPDIHVVASEQGDWTEQSGEQAMERALTKVNDFSVVFGHNDRMAVGARKVLQRRDMLVAKRLYGVDGLPTPGGGVEMVREGTLKATFIYPTYGIEVLRVAMNILQKKHYDKEYRLQGSLVTRANADAILLQQHELDRQAESLDEVQRLVKDYRADYNTQRMTLILSVIIIVLMIVILVVLYRTNIIKSQLNEKLSRRNDELQRLSREVEEMTQQKLVFFTNVSHELRTPLTLIADPVDRLLQDKGMKADDRRLLQVVQRNVGVLLHLVNEILDFRKVQNGKMSLRLNRFDLAEALHRGSGEFAVTAQRKNIKLVVDTDSVTDGIIVADHDKLSHVYVNILSNAMKYTPAGGTITSRLHREGGKFILSVADTGVGIPADDVPKVFDRFFQAKGKTGGTGIGLALVKAYVDLHHGEASASSRVGEGTTITVTLPAEQEGNIEPLETGMVQSVPEGDAPASSAATYAEAAEVALSEQYVPTDVNQEKHLSDVVATEENDKPEVLIIDDNNDVRSYLRTVLADRYHVTEAVDGQQGLQLAHRLVPDLVVCDVMMPVMDGLEFTRQLKADLVTSHIPVILLTARNLDDQMAEGFTEGADSYLTKPFKSTVLLARIDNLLRSREQLRRLYAQQALSQNFAIPSSSVSSASSALAITVGPASSHDRASSVPSSPTRMASAEQAFLSRLRAVIQQNLDNSDISVEDIGAKIGLSRVQLYRKVKALTGQSPVELLRTARLERARQLLLTTDQTNSEVAYAVGFTSPSYFSKCFKDAFGQTPQEAQGS